jgi:hypothetical protein
MAEHLYGVERAGELLAHDGARGGAS